MGVNLPSIGGLWPIFPTLAGLVFMAAYFMGSEKDAGLLIPGVSSFLIGIFFFFFTMGVFEWAEMGRLWPIFPLIGGIAFVAVWMAGGRKDFGLLIPAGGALAVGVVGLIFTLGGFNFARIANFWPIILIVVGLGILIQNFIDRGGK